MNHWRWDPKDFWVDVYHYLHIQNTSLFFCDWCWLQRVSRGNGNRANLPESGQIGQQGPIWALHSSKFAKVCIRTWVKAIFAGKLFGRTKSCHQPFVGYVSDGRKKCDIKTDKQCKWTSFKMQISKLFRCFPAYHWVVSFMVCGLLPTTFFQSGIYFTTLYFTLVSLLSILYISYQL